MKRIGSRMFRSIRPLWAVAALAVTGCGGDGIVSQQAPERAPAAKPAIAEAAAGRYIVVLRDDVVDVRGVAAALARAHGSAPDFVYEHAIKGFAAPLSSAAAANLARNARVKYVEPDHIATIVGGVDSNGKTGKGKPGGDSGTAPPQVTPWGIARVGGGGDASSVGAAWIIDTGIDLDHPDLNVDVARSVSFVTRGKWTPDDGNGHGTHVAGTVAAIDNDIDVIGVAPGASVVAVRVLDSSGSGYYSWVIAGVDHVAANGNSGDVANMSLGGPASQALDDAVFAASATVKFSLAAGNSATHANNASPARVNGANIYTVSAFGQGDVWASFSNFGNPPVDFSAPGVNVLSTKRGGGVTTFNGTSMAAPHVAGLLLLGTPVANGSVTEDPDGNSDPIAHH